MATKKNISTGVGEISLPPIQLPSGVEAGVLSKIIFNVLYRRAFIATDPWSNWILLAAVNILEKGVAPRLDIRSLCKMQGLHFDDTISTFLEGNRKYSGIKEECATKDDFTCKTEHENEFPEVSSKTVIYDKPGDIPSKSAKRKIELDMSPSNKVAMTKKAGDSDNKIEEEDIDFICEVKKAKSKERKRNGKGRRKRDSDDKAEGEKVEFDALYEVKKENVSVRKEVTDSRIPTVTRATETDNSFMMLSKDVQTEANVKCNFEMQVYPRQLVLFKHKWTQMRKRNINAFCQTDDTLKVVDLKSMKDAETQVLLEKNVTHRECQTVVKNVAQRETQTVVRSVADKDCQTIIINHKDAACQYWCKPKSKPWKLTPFSLSGRRKPVVRQDNHCRDDNAVGGDGDMLISNLSNDLFHGRLMITSKSKISTPIIPLYAVDSFFLSDPRKDPIDEVLL